MYKIHKLKSGLPVITIQLPSVQSVTTLIAVHTGGRNETKKEMGLSHFLEHMFFKGSKKYPSPEMISTIVDGMGAVNNAWTSKEETAYWIKSSAKNLDKSLDMLSSMFNESLFDAEEIEKEKGVIIEEMRMVKDNPDRYVSHLYDQLLFGDQPLGWDVIGTEETVSSFKREDFINYVKTRYTTENVALVFAGNLPDNILELAEQYMGQFVTKGTVKSESFQQPTYSYPKVDIFFKQTDQAKLVMGVPGFDRKDPKRYATRILAVVLGSGMSSRLWREIRQNRGLAYYVGCDHDVMDDVGQFVAYSGIKLDKIEEGIKIIKEQFEKTAQELIPEEEIQKAKDMIRGRVALSSESTNFLAEHFGIKYVHDGELETFEEFLKKIDAVTADQVQAVAKELFTGKEYTVQIIAPLKDTSAIEKILS